MRIAIFSETFLPGTDGVVTRLCATLNHLSAEHHDILLFAPHGAPDTFASARVVGIPAFRFAIYPEKKFARPFPKVGKILREFQPDLIHSINPGFLGPAAIYYARRFRIPLISSYHTHIPAYAEYYKMDWLEPFLWWCFRALHNRAQINLCPSEATLQELGKRGFRNLALWDRGVDLNLFSPSRRSEIMRNRLLNGEGPGRRILLYVGRLAAEKGIERLRHCLDEYPDVQLAIVGDGPHRVTLERVFAGTRTTFTGYLFGEELAEAYASADGFVFPSTTETLGLVLFEATASGLPVMAADSFATREVLDEGGAGLIFDPFDPQSISNVIRELLMNDERRHKLRSRAVEAVANLDWSKPTRQLVTHYHRLLHPDHSPSPRASDDVVH